MHQVVVAFAGKNDAAIRGDCLKLIEQAGEAGSSTGSGILIARIVPAFEGLDVVHGDEAYGNLEEVGDFLGIGAFFVVEQRFVDYGVGAQIVGAAGTRGKLAGGGCDCAGIEAAAE